MDVVDAILIVFALSPTAMNAPDPRLFETMDMCEQAGMMTMDTAPPSPNGYPWQLACISVPQARAKEEGT